MTSKVSLQKANNTRPSLQNSASVMACSCSFKNYYAVFVNFYIIHQPKILKLLAASLGNHAKVADFKAVFSEYILNIFGV